MIYIGNVINLLPYQTEKSIRYTKSGTPPIYAAAPNKITTVDEAQFSNNDTKKEYVRGSIVDKLV